MLVAGGAFALDGKNRYLILGPGADSCATVITNLAEGEKIKSQAAVVIYSNWLAGSLSAYNRDTKNTYSILGDMEFTEAFEWSVKFCQDHPGAIYSAAVDTFVKEFYVDRYKSMDAASKPKKKPVVQDKNKLIEEYDDDEPKKKPSPAAKSKKKTVEDDFDDGDYEDGK